MIAVCFLFFLSTFYSFLQLPFFFTVTASMFTTFSLVYFQRVPWQTKLVDTFQTWLCP